ncbi:M14 family metallopeptidase [Microbulbifer hainanensis]|uniref:M14 family metallopeptidase n=1 Tax=Microbulbifer hainanensis TaxID=2735675 RepID=UPI001865F2A8|nr:M14 metallopeptidase family protein [Microbulbifer hainanensis]
MNRLCRRLAIAALGGLLCSAAAIASEPDYAAYRQGGLDQPGIRQADILPLIKQLQSSSLLDVAEIARSYEGRPIYRMQIGHGEIKVLMWSQMHGDEPTATAALFDLVNFMLAPEQAQWRAGWEDKLTLVMVPMLNPDGAERGIRHNAQSFDVNRDAKALQSPEGRALMQLARSLRPDFGFNLHDQNRHYGVGDSGKMATISVLAPAFNAERDINASRKRAMQLIGALKRAVAPAIGENIGRYNDTYAWRAFGDTFSEMDVSTVLIESGAHPRDPNRQVARHMNFNMLIAAIDSIASGSYREVSLAEYQSIPFNRDEAIVDLKIRNIATGEGDAAYTTDLAMNAGDAYIEVIDVGDLSNLTGARDFDAGGWRYRAPRPYPLSGDSPLVLDDEKYRMLLREGYGYFVGDAEALQVETEFPVVLNPRRPQGDTPSRRHDATFLLDDDRGVRAAVLNGQVLDLREAVGKIDVAAE